MKRFVFMSILNMSLRMFVASAFLRAVYSKPAPSVEKVRLSDMMNPDMKFASCCHDAGAAMCIVYMCIVL